MRLISAEEVLPSIAQYDYTKSDVRADLLADEDCGPLLRVYIALTDGRLGGDLTPEDRLYNRYFWFLRFAHVHHTKYGEDGGIDQQAFQILEYADCDVDWDLLEQLTEKAKQSS